MKASDWYQFKLFLEHASGISMDALHILVGVGIFLLTAAFLRRGITDIRALLVLLVLEVGNEIYDLYVERWPDLGMQLGEGFKDLLLTMAIPFALTGVARVRPSLFTQQGHSGDA